MGSMQNNLNHFINCKGLPHMLFLSIIMPSFHHYLIGIILYQPPKVYTTKLNKTFLYPPAIFHY